MIKTRKILFCILTFFVSFSIQAQELAPGLEYQKSTTPLQQTVHILQVNPTLLKIIPAHAEDKVIGRETVAQIAQRYKAIAAINGGFFKMGESAEGFSLDGLPAGILRIQGKWFGVAYRSRGAIGWSGDTQIPLMDRVQTKTQVALNQTTYPVHAVNQPGSPFNATLYTEAYGTAADTPPGSQDIVIQNQRIVAVHDRGHTSIPKGGYVYSFGQKVKNYSPPLIKKGQTAAVNIEIIPDLFKKEHSQTWKQIDNIVGGTPLLISQGKILALKQKANAPPSTFLHERYARSAVGTLKNGHWIFIVVEQNALTGSPGMTIPELATFMQQLGCEHALNLDGGGSSTLYINDKVINHPEGDEDEAKGIATIRPVSDAILILPR